METNAPEPIPGDLITTLEARRLARCNLVTLYRWCESGRLRYWKRCGRRFVSRSEVLALFQEGQPKPAEKRERRCAPPSPAAVAARRAWVEREADRLGL